MSKKRKLSRKEFLQFSATAAIALTGCRTAPFAASSAKRKSRMSLATFRFDVTPPMGHPLCGGWIRPVVGYDDSLEALGVVLLGAGKPIVICAVDWTGLLNEAHIAWRQALAEAAGTSPERVAVQCVHQHNAPFACLEGQRIVGAQPGLPSIVDLVFFDECLQRGRRAVTECLQRIQPVTHIACSQGTVHQVASNRRILGEDGTVKFWRGSRSAKPTDAELPEGLVDSQLRTVAFYHGDTKVAACHYYATHPMSYYGDGRVSSDFAGLARKQRAKDEPGCQHIYFTGCAGNVAAGKYNDGSPAMRSVLARRIYDGIIASEAVLQPVSLEEVVWRTREVQPPPRSSPHATALEAVIHDGQRNVADRNRSALRLAWLRRCQRQTPIVISALQLNDATLLHLPSEAFVEYQLRAQQMADERFVAVAAYGDGGPWYIPTAEAFPQGGYEVDHSFCDPEVDGVLTGAMTTLLT